MQASIFDHPVLKRKLVTRCIVSESRGRGWDGGGMDKGDKSGYDRVVCHGESFLKLVDNLIVTDLSAYRPRNKGL